MDHVDAGSEDDLAGDDAETLFFEVGADLLEDGAVVEESLMPDSDVGGQPKT